MPSTPNHPQSYAIWMGLVVVCAVGGCQYRAYNDLYTESMAGEIRELEDRIYEYDAAYQGLEDELMVLQDENARLHAMVRQSQVQNSPWKTNNSLLGQPNQSSPAAPTPSRPLPSADNLPPPNQRSLPTPAPLEPLPDSLPNQEPKAASPADKGSTKPKVESLEPPLIEMGIPIAPPTTAPPTTAPPTTAPPTTAPPITVPPATAPSAAPTTTPPTIELLPSKPPTKDQGAMNANEKKSRLEIATANRGLPTELAEDVINESRIALPQEVITASFASPPATATPLDTRVVEIGFHPSLCRGQNLDRVDGDDGLYVVLQPKNGMGEILDQAAAVTLVAVDPKVPNGEGRIGRWTFTRDEVDAALEPVGVSHGYHLSLPWQGVLPTGEMVQLYVRYEMEDGKRLVNERSIQLHVPSLGSSAWTPRVTPTNRSLDR